ncbi:MAG: hypothetical protein ABR574_04435 [Cryomorphaceae bacterium]|nr:hypothetical protein [Flavobacteriales bacterium]
MKTQLELTLKEQELRRARKQAGARAVQRNAGGFLLVRSWLERITNIFEGNRFGAMTVMLTFQSCLGSVAAYYATMNNAELAVILAASVTMSSNAAFIAQSPAAWCVRIFIISLIANISIIALNIL